MSLENGMKKTSKRCNQSEAERNTPSVSSEPFTEGLEQALAEDPNESRKERLKDAIKTHAKNNRGKKASTGRRKK